MWLGLSSDIWTFLTHAWAEPNFRDLPVEWGRAGHSPHSLKTAQVHSCLIGFLLLLGGCHKTLSVFNLQICFNSNWSLGPVLIAKLTSQTNSSFHRIKFNSTIRFYFSFSQKQRRRPFQNRKFMRQLNKVRYLDYRRSTHNENRRWSCNAWRYWRWCCGYCCRRCAARGCCSLDCCSSGWTLLVVDGMSGVVQQLFSMLLCRAGWNEI